LCKLGAFNFEVSANPPLPANAVKLVVTQDSQTFAIETELVLSNDVDSKYVGEYGVQVTFKLQVEPPAFASQFFILIIDEVDPCEFESSSETKPA